MKKTTLRLEPDEELLLLGGGGPLLQKIMKSVVLYGEAFGAERLAPVTGAPHFAMSFGASIITPYYAILDELIEGGLRPGKPFTTNPRTYDFDGFPSSPFERLLSRIIYRSQQRLERQLNTLGLADQDAFSCACYLPEIGNVPKPGDILAWSESSAVVFANSTLGARTNRNSAGIDVLMNVIGKAPLYGLLTDEGRRAAWRIDVATSALPNPQLLGSAVGMRVVEEVPYIVGLDRHLESRSEAAIRDYLKDMGAASASNGAVGLFHIENITPEARESRRELLRRGHRTYVIDDNELERVAASYPVLWKNPEAYPARCLIGCPHLSFDQVSWWIERIRAALDGKKRRRLAVDTILNAPPAVATKIRRDKALGAGLGGNGLFLSSICPVAFLTNPLSSRKPTVTNSNKLRTYTTARFLDDTDVLEIISG
jgi:predicted aconitase